MKLSNLFSDFLESSKKSSHENDPALLELGLGKVTLEQIYKAQLPLSDLTRHNLRLKELAKALEEVLVEQLSNLNIDRLIDLLNYARTLEQIDFYYEGIRDYDIRERPFRLCLGVMKLPGPWEARLCHALAPLWLEKLKTLFPKTFISGQQKFVGSWALTEISKFLRTIKSRNPEALQEGECLQIVLELESLLAKASQKKDPVRLRATLQELRNILGEQPSEDYDFPITNTTHIEFSVLPENKIQLSRLQHFVAEINALTEEIHTIRKNLVGKGIGHEEIRNITLDKLGFDHSALLKYAEFRDDLKHRFENRKNDEIYYRLLMSSLARLSTEYSTYQVMTIEQVTSLWNRLDTLSYETHDFGADAPPCPDLLFVGTEFGVEVSQLLMAAKGTSPTKKWVKKAEELSARIGDNQVSTNLSNWLLLNDVGEISDKICIDRMNAKHLTNSAQLLQRMLENDISMRDAAIIANGDRTLLPLCFSENSKAGAGVKVQGSEPFISSETNSIIGKAAVWWLCQIKPNDIEDILTRVSRTLGMRILHHNNGKPGPVTRSLSVTNACLAGLSGLETKKSKDALKELRDYFEDPRLSKRVASLLS